MKSNPEMGAHFSHDFVRYSQAHFGASLGCESPLSPTVMVIG
jgi:hypothetical protein